ncbi:hypothetical protein CYMTET_45479 [Cymbomonas tetramitiformis]|uniref:Uncharacterized protein n=1 Tax=Cymbomonas tetramitiformis TaxID=36881 RepID=A0AAE0EY99_9CHLO|nr:hypothetical protein CYMTET_45479 [Cymbomonas tetramitiformis]
MEVEKGRRGGDCGQGGGRDGGAEDVERVEGLGGGLVEVGEQGRVGEELAREGHGYGGGGNGEVGVEAGWWEEEVVRVGVEVARERVEGNWDLGAGRRALVEGTVVEKGVGGDGEVLVEGNGGGDGGGECGGGGGFGGGWSRVGGLVAMGKEVVAYEVEVGMVMMEEGVMVEVDEQVGMGGQEVQVLAGAAAEEGTVVGLVVDFPGGKGAMGVARGSEGLEVEVEMIWT